jgi:transposase-like protein
VSEQEKRIKRKFTEEFKLEAIALGKKVGNTQVARDLGINESQIRQWKKRLDNLPESSNKKSYAELEKEVRKLSKEIGYLKEINEVLKKALRFSQRII